MDKKDAYIALRKVMFAALHNDDGTDEDAHELYEALSVTLPVLLESVRCDRCGKAKAKVYSESTGNVYCNRCYKALTDSRTPY